MKKKGLKKLKQERFSLVSALCSELFLERVISILERIEEIDIQIDKKKRKKKVIVWFDECTELTPSSWAKIKRNNARHQITKNTTAAINLAIGLPKMEKLKFKISSDDIISDQAIQNMKNMYCEDLASRVPYSIIEIMCQYNRLSGYYGDRKIKAVLDHALAMSMRYNVEINDIIGDIIQVIKIESR